MTARNETRQKTDSKKLIKTAQKQRDTSGYKYCFSVIETGI